MVCSSRDFARGLLLRLTLRLARWAPDGAIHGGDAGCSFEAITRSRRQSFSAVTRPGASPPISPRCAGIAATRNYQRPSLARRGAFRRRTAIHAIERFVRVLQRVLGELPFLSGREQLRWAQLPRIFAVPFAD